MHCVTSFYDPYVDFVSMVVGKLDVRPRRCPGRQRRGGQEGGGKEHSLRCAAGTLAVEHPKNWGFRAPLLRVQDCRGPGPKGGWGAILGCRVLLAVHLAWQSMACSSDLHETAPDTEIKDDPTQLEQEIIMLAATILFLDPRWVRRFLR